MHNIDYIKKLSNIIMKVKGSMIKRSFIKK